MSRYSQRKTVLNQNRLYTDLIKARGKNYLLHYGNPKNVSISIAQRATLNPITHIWQHNDKLWKIASKYYNKPKMWWVIAAYNEKPTDAHYVQGDIISIPYPLEKVLEYMGY